MFRLFVSNLNKFCKRFWGFSHDPNVTGIGLKFLRLIYTEYPASNIKPMRRQYSRTVIARDIVMFCRAVICSDS
jgi:hypothetical protein